MKGTSRIPQGHGPENHRGNRCFPSPLLVFLRDFTYTSSTAQGGGGSFRIGNL